MTLSENPLGLHILLTLQTNDNEKLVDASRFIRFTEEILIKFKLEKVGFTSHIFENNSFTVAFCLMESHICIHTWPENKNLALDIYLCNYSQDNTQKVRAIAGEYIDFFNATVSKKTEVNR